MGIFWGNHKRIVGVLHGLKTNELAMDERIPILLKRTHLLDINEIDSYFGQLRQRVHEGRVDL